MKYFIGIDLGGTFIKGGICNENGDILVKDSVPTEVVKGGNKIVENICNLAKSLCKALNICVSQCEGVGVGVPGMIDTALGEVVFASNLHLEHFKLQEYISKELNLKVIIANDANVAALGEAKFGASSSYSSSVLVTLGTGVGGGIIIDKKIFAGNRSAGAEIGHMIIEVDGKECGCGLKGCYEKYASASGLISLTKEYMLQDKDSKLWEEGIDNVNGISAFKYASVDKTANAVLQKYLDYVAVGLVNIANIFRPEAILLGGGISNSGDELLIPLVKRLENMVFAGDKGPKVELKIASLKNDAGLKGACALLMD